MIYHRRGDGIISRRAPFDNQGGTPFIQRSFRRLPRVGAGGAGVGQLGSDVPVRAADAGDIGLEDRPEDLLFLVPLGFIGVGAFYLPYFNTVRECTVGTAAILLYSSRCSWYFWSGSF